MEPMLDAFAAEVKSATFNAPGLPFFSTVLGCKATQEFTKLSYWTDHVRGTVRFMDAMQALEEAHCPDVYLEIGAMPTLVNMARRFVPRKSANWIPSLEKGR